MQTLTRSSATSQVPQSETIQYLRHQQMDTIPQGHVLALDAEAGMLSHLCMDTDGKSHVIAHQFLNASEMALFRLLHAAAPHFCLNEELLATHTYGTPTEAQLADCRVQLHEAIGRGQREEAMKTLRMFMSRIRLRLASISVEIAPLLKTGYMLQFPADFATQGISDIEYLQGALPDGQVLSFDPGTRVLSLLNTQNDLPCLVRSCQLTGNEARVMQPILAAYPRHASLTELFASFTYQEVNKETLTRAAEHLQEARELALLDDEFRAMRNMIFRARKKLGLVGLELVTVLGKGYLVTYSGLPKDKQRRNAS